MRQPRAQGRNAPLEFEHVETQLTKKKKEKEKSGGAALEVDVYFDRHMKLLEIIFFFLSVEDILHCSTTHILYLNFNGKA